MYIMVLNYIFEIQWLYILGIEQFIDLSVQARNILLQLSRNTCNNACNKNYCPSISLHYPTWYLCMVNLHFECLPISRVHFYMVRMPPIYCELVTFSVRQHAHYPLSLLMIKPYNLSFYPTIQVKLLYFLSNFSF